MSGEFIDIKSNYDFSLETGENLSILARIAIYDNMLSMPRVVDLKYDNIKDFIDSTCEKVYSLSHDVGGKIPYTIIKEIIENLIHASFREVTITILNNGNNIIISDQGDGIPDKNKAFMPGYTSATRHMKKYIRGVGSGLPIVKETISFSGGEINIADNIKQGTVVTLKLGSVDNENNPVGVGDNVAPKEPVSTPEDSIVENISKHYSRLKLTQRQKKILSLILELEEVGPSRVSKELNFSLSTAHRELIFLEKIKLLTSSSTGKRKLSYHGKKYLEYYSNNY